MFAARLQQPSLSRNATLQEVFSEERVHHTARQSRKSKKKGNVQSLNRNFRLRVSFCCVYQVRRVGTCLCFWCVYFFFAFFFGGFLLCLAFYMGQFVCEAVESTSFI